MIYWRYLSHPFFFLSEGLVNWLVCSLCGGCRMEHFKFYFDFIVIKDTTGLFLFFIYFQWLRQILLSSQDHWWLDCDAEWTLQVSGRDGVRNSRLKKIYRTKKSWFCVVPHENVLLCFLVVSRKHYARGPDRHFCSKLAGMACHWCIPHMASSSPAFPGFAVSGRD